MLTSKSGSFWFCKIEAILNPHVSSRECYRQVAPWKRFINDSLSFLEDIQITVRAYKYNFFCCLANISFQKVSSNSCHLGSVMEKIRCEGSNGTSSFAELSVRNFWISAMEGLGKKVLKKFLTLKNYCHMKLGMTLLLP